MVSGQIKRSDKDYIYVEITEEDLHSFMSICDKQCFDISFHMNRVGYQLQHRALDYMEQHGLHSILINNKQYDSIDDSVDNVASDVGSSENFSGRLAEGLNNEQKMAVKFITKSDNLLPYLLFGPAG